MDFQTFFQQARAFFGLSENATVAEVSEFISGQSLATMVEEAAQKAAEQVASANLPAENADELTPRLEAAEQAIAAATEAQTANELALSGLVEKVEALTTALETQKTESANTVATLTTQLKALAGETARLKGGRPTEQADVDTPPAVDVPNAPKGEQVLSVEGNPALKARIERAKKKI